MIIPALALLLAATDIRTPDPVGPMPTPEIVSAVGPTRFTAVNVTNNAQLVLLGTQDGGALAHAVLPPHGVLRYRYPRGTAEELWIDFVSPTENGVAHTGPIALAELIGTDLAFVDDQNVFAQHGQSVRWVQPRAEPRFAPMFWRTPIQQLSTHVPVPKPIKPNKGEKPPKVGDAPLEVF